MNDRLATKAPSRVVLLKDLSTPRPALDTQQVTAHLAMEAKGKLGISEGGSCTPTPNLELAPPPTAIDPTVSRPFHNTSVELKHGLVAVEPPSRS